MSETAEVKAAEGAGGEELVPVTIEGLQEALGLEKAQNEILVGQVVALEDEIVNRCMSDFDSVISDGTREFWREQLLANRKGATVALTEMAGAKGVVVPGSAETHRPLHNRSTARPQTPAAVGGPAAGSGQAGNEPDERAAKIRNRAHEISRADRVAFPMAFRRAELEVGG